MECIDASTLKNLFISAANYIESKKKYIDDLNVFPVPDGDTGTNMSLTILAAAREVKNLSEVDMKQLSKAISNGSLRGARGNSGVILSQLLRGFSKIIAEYDQIDSNIFAQALKQGSDTAYKAVMKPQEGTILTVAREAADKAVELATESNDIIYVIKETIDYAEGVLQKTPDMLPVLKEAGVVDAGGEGLLCIYRGVLASLESGEVLEFELEEEVLEPTFTETPGVTNIEFGYCTEFIINANETNLIEEESNKLKQYLESLGDSVVVVSDEEIIKVHVHTNDPGKAIQKSLEIGELTNIKIDNMREQLVLNVETISAMEQKQPRKEFGFVVVAFGDGINKIFKDLGVDYIIEGGQTMNPSTEDIINAIDKVNANHVFILPNNKNVIMAANQARDIYMDKKVIVIPTKSIPQGIASMINFEQDKTVEDNIMDMEEGMTDVSTGQLTFAVRDTSVDGIDIKEGDILGIADGKIVTVNKDLDESAKELMKQLIDEDSELVTIYYGKEVDEVTAQAFGHYIEEEYDFVDVEIHYGGQPLYYYILSVE